MVQHSLMKNPEPDDEKHAARSTDMLQCSSDPWQRELFEGFVAVAGDYTAWYPPSSARGPGAPDGTRHLRSGHLRPGQHGFNRHATHVMEKRFRSDPLAVCAIDRVLKCTACHKLRKVEGGQGYFRCV